MDYGTWAILFAFVLWICTIQNEVLKLRKKLKVLQADIDNYMKDTDDNGAYQLSRELDQSKGEAIE